jgi:hypothetical protein
MVRSCQQGSFTCATSVPTTPFTSSNGQIQGLSTPFKSHYQSTDHKILTPIFHLSHSGPFGRAMPQAMLSRRSTARVTSWRIHA